MKVMIDKEYLMNFMKKEIKNRKEHLNSSKDLLTHINSWDESIEKNNCIESCHRLIDSHEKSIGYLTSLMDELETI